MTKGAVAQRMHAMAIDLPSLSLSGISSMATRAVLAELADDFTRRTGVPVALESVGGVDAARRVQAGEQFDVVVLASDAIDKLMASGAAQAGSRVDLVHSGVSVAVQTGQPHPDVGSEEAVRAAVLAAASVGYSTGPSGVALVKLFERWGILAQVQDRLVQAQAGVPVGSMVASGAVALGFQQLSELIHVEGIDVVGPLPDAIQITTTFSGALCATCRHAEAAHALLQSMAAPEASMAKIRQGMDPA